MSKIRNQEVTMKNEETKMFAPPRVPGQNWGGALSPMYAIDTNCPCLDYGSLKSSATCCPRPPAWARPCCITRCHALTWPTRSCPPYRKVPPCSPPRYCKHRSPYNCNPNWCYSPDACYKPLCCRCSFTGRKCGTTYSPT